MSAATSMPGVSLSQAHEQFVAALPAMENAIRFHLRHVPKRHRAEAVSDACASAWHAWYGLLRRGKDPLAVGPTGIALNACRYVRNGRQLGVGNSGRGMDVYAAARKHGLKLVSIHDGAERREWRELLLSDGRVDPGDEAAFSIDLGAWLATLSPRKREAALLLAQGFETGSAAKAMGVTPAAVSISRVALQRSWARFQGQPVEAPLSTARRRRGRPRKGARGTPARSRQAVTLSS